VSDRRGAAPALIGGSACRLIKNAALKVYPGAPHGLTVTHKNKFNDDLRIFVKGLR
jgi:non-heme chloroperoxidase